MADPNQATGVYEVVPPGPANPGQARGKIALVNAAGAAALAASVDTVIADLPATGNTADTVAVKVNEILAALRAAGITKGA